MNNIIYGVHFGENFTPVDVRNAMLNCFIEAHSEILNQLLEFGKDEISKEGAESLKKMNIEVLLRDFFKKVGGDYNNPNKESLLAVAEKLKNFSQSFRAEEVINRHYDEIRKLIEKL